MKNFDVCIIGGGLLGCMSARNLCRYRMSVCLIEAREDVCTGISRANAAIVYAGYDNKSGTLKASMSLKANSAFGELCRELDVPFSRCGSLMTACGPEGEAVLRKKLAQGLATGVPGIALIDGNAARETEPALGPDITSALYAPSTATVNPWELCFAAYENALANGVESLPGSPVSAIERVDGGYVISAGKEIIFCRAVINCAGLAANTVRELLFEPEYRLEREYVDFAVTARQTACIPGHIIMEETEDGKGITAVPTVQGNLLLESRSRVRGNGCSSDSGSVRRTLDRARALMPGCAPEGIIRSFASVRPVVRHVCRAADGYVPDGKNIGHFVIERPESGFISFIGIKSPGLTCSDELTRLAAADLAMYLGAEENPSFNPVRRGICRVHEMNAEQRGRLVRENPDYGNIVCRCCDISRGEIIQAVRRGAVSVGGVKRRSGALLGPCQGGRCEETICEIIATETGRDIRSVTLDGPGSEIFGGADGTL